MKLPGYTAKMTMNQGEKNPNQGESDYVGKLERAAHLLKAHIGPIVIVSHVDPDGDALGSCLGLQRTLRQMGKAAQTYASVPRYLRFLLESDHEILPPGAILEPGALLVVLDVDSHDSKRVEGTTLEDLGQNFVLNIDHHGTNARRAQLSIVEPNKAACALMVAELVALLGVPFTVPIANPLYTGISTDTGSFRFTNTTSEVLEMASDLLGGGADLNFINESLSQTPHHMYRLQAQVLNTVEFLNGGLTVMAQVNSAMLEKVGASWEDVESLVGVIRSAEGTELAVLFKVYSENSVKLSLRSRGRVSAQNIAIALGGGGHVAAAGATVNAGYAEVRRLFELEATQELSRVGMGSGL